jgi:hypothetical protein
MRVGPLHSTDVYDLRQGAKLGAASGNRYIFPCSCGGRTMDGRTVAWEERYREFLLLAQKARRAALNTGICASGSMD